VRLIPAQYVKPNAMTNKNYFIDAEAIAEAVARPTMHFMPIKPDDQLDMQSFHRVRERCLKEGIDGCLSKPIRPREPYEVLDNYVALRRQAKAASEATGGNA
jgi:CheY-like chemotaxis protein